MPGLRAYTPKLPKLIFACIGSPPVLQPTSAFSSRGGVGKETTGSHEPPPLTSKQLKTQNILKAQQPNSSGGKQAPWPTPSEVDLESQKGLGLGSSVSEFRHSGLLVGLGAIVLRSVVC